MASENTAQSVMVQDTDLTALLLAMHATGGEYMRDAKYNIQSLAAKGDDFFVMMNAGMLLVTPANLVFDKDMHEHDLWISVTASSDIRTYVMSVTERSGERITGNLCEVELFALQHGIRKYSLNFTHMDVEMKDGTTRRITRDEWDTMEKLERGQLVSWTKHYAPSDAAKLAAYLGVLRWAVKENRQTVSVGAFLSEINKVYMDSAAHPQPDMIRITAEAAKEILASGAADVYRLFPGKAEQLSPIDAIKVPVYINFREYAVKASDTAGIEKWARRSAGEMLRQMEHSAREKSKQKDVL